MNDEDDDDPIIAPAQLVGDLQNLDETLRNDNFGEKARAMLDYFDNAAKASEQMLARAGSDDERRTVRTLYDGFIACRTVVEQTWQSMHHAQLTY
jgi:hypothetical protein